MNRNLRQIFLAPAVVAALSVVGLLSALAGDGAWDVLSWLALAPSVALAVWPGLPRLRRPRWRGRAPAA